MKKSDAERINRDSKILLWLIGISTAVAIALAVALVVMVVKEVERDKDMISEEARAAAESEFWDRVARYDAILEEIERNKTTEVEESASVETETEGVELVPTNYWGQPIDTDYRTTLYADYNIPVEMWDYMIELLRAQEIEFFLPYMVAQVQAESGWNYLAENPNGLDKGLLQYRMRYWPSVCVGHQFPAETPWTDWKVQMFIYVFDSAHRLRQGCSVWEVISRHKTSDYYLEFDDEYVRQVQRWIRIPNSHDGMEEGYPKP